MHKEKQELLQNEYCTLEYTTPFMITSFFYDTYVPILGVNATFLYQYLRECAHSAETRVHFGDIAKQFGFLDSMIYDAFERLEALSLCYLVLHNRELTLILKKPHDPEVFFTHKKLYQLFLSNISKEMSEKIVQKYERRNERLHARPLFTAIALDSKFDLSLAQKSSEMLQERLSFSYATYTVLLEDRGIENDLTNKNFETFILEKAKEYHLTEEQLATFTIAALKSNGRVDMHALLRRIQSETTAYFKGNPSLKDLDISECIMDAKTYNPEQFAKRLLKVPLTTQSIQFIQRLIVDTKVRVEVLNMGVALALRDTKGEFSSKYIAAVIQNIASLELAEEVVAYDLERKKRIEEGSKKGYNVKKRKEPLWLQNKEANEISHMTPSKITPSKNEEEVERLKEKIKTFLGD